jgi:hypothetical protein
MTILDHHDLAVTIHSRGGKNRAWKEIAGRLCGLFNNVVCTSCYMASSDLMMNWEECGRKRSIGKMIDEWWFWRDLEDSVYDFIEVIYRNFPGGLKALASRPRFEPDTSRIQVTSITSSIDVLLFKSARFARVLCKTWHVDVLHSCNFHPRLPPLRLTLRETDLQVKVVVRPVTDIGLTSN